MMPLLVRECGDDRPGRLGSRKKTKAIHGRTPQPLGVTCRSLSSSGACPVGRHAMLERWTGSQPS
jgi:hypothetical protein